MFLAIELWKVLSGRGVFLDAWWWKNLFKVNINLHFRIQETHAGSRRHQSVVFVSQQLLPQAQLHDVAHLTHRFALECAWDPLDFPVFSDFFGAEILSKNGFNSGVQND